MITTKRYISLLLLPVFCWGTVWVSPRGFAADGDGTTAANAPVAASSKAKSQNVTVNLINRLVKRGVLSAEDAGELIQQAENDAAEARAQAAKAGPEPAPNDTVSVRYIPEIVKAQIREEIKDDVLKQARAERWAAPNAVPAWVSRFKVNGDIRIRYEDLLYPQGNDNTGGPYLLGWFPAFNSINTGSPYTPSSSTFPPQRDVDQDRNRLRLRARIGAEIDLDSGFTAGLRLATGENSSPVSPNQSMGAANQAQGGNFSKYAIWLDQAFIKYEMGGLPTKNLAVLAGRFENPFFSTSEIIWDSDLGFDGIVVQGKKEMVEGVTAFGTAGMFPIFNTDLNFSSNRPDKYPSTDKWLFGGQLGVEWKINKDLSFKGAGAFYYFDQVEGRQSTSTAPFTSADRGDTDNTRPAFAQYGNTYRELRQSYDAFGTLNPQYYGLATPFHDIAFTGRLDYKHFEPFTISLTGEFVKNLAFDWGHINNVAVNNLGPVSGGLPGAFVGSDTAWIVGVKVGHVALQKRWDWNLSLNYRYVGSDAVVDGLCDSDFGGGGTNVKGFTIAAALALAPKISLGLRWMSSDQVAGPTLKNDTFQFDLNAKF